MGSYSKTVLNLYAIILYFKLSLSINWYGVTECKYHIVSWNKKYKPCTLDTRTIRFDNLACQSSKNNNIEVPRYSLLMLLTLEFARGRALRLGPVELIAYTSTPRMYFCMVVKFLSLLVLDGKPRRAFIPTIRFNITNHNRAVIKKKLRLCYEKCYDSLQNDKKHIRRVESKNISFLDTKQQ